jgi:hypothetical protein
LSESNYAQGWECAELQLGRLVYDLFLTTTGRLYCLSNKTKTAQNRHNTSANSTGKGLLADMLADVGHAAVQSAVSAGTDFSSDSGTLEERLAADKRNVYLSCVELQEFFIGELGWGFKKRRIGIYLRPEYRRKMPGLGSPTDISLTLQTGPSNPAVWKRWCDVLNIPCEGTLDEWHSRTMRASYVADNIHSDLADPIWLEGPELGNVSQTAEEAFAWMRDNMGSAVDYPPPSRPPHSGSARDQRQEESGSKVVPILSAVMGGGSLLLTLASFVAMFASPVLSIFFACVLYPLNFVGLLLGIIGLLTSSGSGRLIAGAGIAMVVLSFVMNCAGGFFLPQLMMMLSSM